MQVSDFAGWEWALRSGAFVGVFTAMAIWEARAPRRVRLHQRSVRWVAHLSLVALDSLILRLLFPMAAVGFAALAAERSWGLLNVFEMPFWFAFGLSLLALDFVIYLQLVMFHAVPLLWRLHRIHHSMVMAESNSNYGFNLPWWDRIFGTYRAAALLPQEALRIGVEGITDDARAVTLTGMLAIPFSPDAVRASAQGEMT